MEGGQRRLSAFSVKKTVGGAKRNVLMFMAGVKKFMKTLINGHATAYLLGNELV